MNTATQLVRDEIDKAGLPKRATNILEKFDSYISFMNQREPKPDKIPVYQKDYETLAEKLKADGQDIKNRLYRGYRLVRHAD